MDHQVYYTSVVYEEQNKPIIFVLVIYNFSIACMQTYLLNQLSSAVPPTQLNS